MTERVLLSLGWPHARLNPNNCKGRHWSWNVKQRNAAKAEGWRDAH